MKVISLTCAHYGLGYLEAALRSVADSVDECWILYSSIPSFGHFAPMPCPETREMLFAAAERGAGMKLRWFDGAFYNESHHREAIYSLVPDADYVLVVDTDEVYQEGLPEDMIRHFESHPEHRSIRPLTTHYWRSFYRGMLNDTLHAEHAWAWSRQGSYGYLESDKRIHHFGYAQGEVITEYKIHTHGHKKEWRSDWWDTKFLPNAQVDVHPVIKEFWNAEAIDPFAIGLPTWMQEHEYAKCEVIR